MATNPNRRKLPTFPRPTEDTTGRRPMPSISPVSSGTKRGSDQDSGGRAPVPSAIPSLRSTKRTRPVVRSTRRGTST